MNQLRKSYKIDGNLRYYIRLQASLQSKTGNSCVLGFALSIIDTTYPMYYHVGQDFSIQFQRYTGD